MEGKGSLSSLSSCRGRLGVRRGGPRTQSWWGGGGQSDHLIEVLSPQETPFKCRSPVRSVLQTERGQGSSSGEGGYMSFISRGSLGQIS